MIDYFHWRLLRGDQTFCELHKDSRTAHSLPGRGRKASPRRVMMHISIYDAMAEDPALIRVFRHVRKEVKERKGKVAFKSFLSHRQS